MIKNYSVIYITSHGVCFLIRLISVKFLWALQGIFALIMRVTESVSNDFTLTRLKKIQFYHTLPQLSFLSYKE